jgi:HAD superfamily hydrolase (TIGR01509 family)
VRGLIGEGIQSLAEKALAVSAPASKLDATTIAREVVRRYTERPCVASRLYPGVADTLAALRARGCHLAVLTNKMGHVARALLAALSVSEVFETVVGDGDGFRRKPAPDAAHALMTRFAATPASTLMVGDGLPDLAIARAAGCRAAGVTWGYTDRALLAAQRPDYLVATPADLLALE